MSEHIFQPVRHVGVRKGIACGFLLVVSIQTQALEIGFQGLVQMEGSDNIEFANSPDEQNGTIQSAELGVYGEQRSRLVTAGFSGELDLRKTSTDNDSDINSISRFLGAAEFKITPRSWTWYVGDILGGVRNDDALQPIDDSGIDRRNVFVTGPAFEYEQQGISRTSARALYVNQTQNDEALENLYSANFSHERDLTRGSYYGFRLGNIYTDLPDADDTVAQGERSEQDFNRSTAAAFYNHQIGFLDLFGEVGMTRYDADDGSLDGLNAELRVTRELGPETSASVFIRRDLNDQSLSAVESLVQSGDAAVGIAPDTAGFFTETRIGAQYNFQGIDTSIDLIAGIGELDYQLLSGGARGGIDVNGEDRQQGFASAAWSQRLDQQLRAELLFSYETQDYDNLPDNSRSVLLTAQLIYSMSRSLDLQLGITHDTGTGLRTQFTGGTGIEEDIDRTENRLAVGVRWAPPSRASQELTVELKSLLQ